MHRTLLFAAALLACAAQIRAAEPAATKKQFVTVELTVYEVSVTKLRALGFDWDASSPGKPAADRTDVLKSASGKQLAGFLQALKQNGLANVVSEPKLMTLSGRPASLEVGPTRLQVTPLILESGRIQVGHRLQLSHSGMELRSESTLEVDSGQAVIANAQMRREQKDAAGKVNEIETLAIVRATAEVPALR